MHFFSFCGRLRWVWVATLLLALVGTFTLAACGETASPQPSPTTVAASPSPSPTPIPSPTPASVSPTATNVVQVSIVENNNQYSFEPATLTVPKGTQVVWTNKSDAPHTVSSDSNAFGTTSNLAATQTFSMIFTTAGTYAYHCNIHTYMKATIIVTA